MKNIALDISKDDFYLAILDGEKPRTERMLNNQESFNEFNKRFDPKEYRVVMEATGNYHKPLAYYLLENNYAVSVVSGSVNYYYGKSKNSTIKNDPRDAINLLDYANRHEDKLPEFKLKEEQIMKLNSLRKTFETYSIEKQRIANKIHSALYDKYFDKEMIRFFEETILHFESHMLKIQQEIEKIVGDKFRINDELVQTIHGVGPGVANLVIPILYAFPVLNEEESIEKFSNQVLKYVGLAPTEYTSGTSVKGKSTINKGAGAQLKSALYMACVNICCRCKTNCAFKVYYQNLRARGLCFKKAITNTMAKLLRIIVYVIRTGQPYDLQKHLLAVAK